MSRVLVVEDQADLAFGLKKNLEFDGYEARVAPDGETGLDLARSWQPDLVILDLMLPDTDGFQVLRQMRSDGSEVPVLLLTALGEEVDKVRGLQLGADDYVTKPFGLLELLARVEALLRRTGRAEASAARFGDVEVRMDSRTVTKGGVPVELTPKEFDLILALLRRRGAAASRLDLLEEVWGYSGAVVSRTVDTHIAAVRRKLEDDPASPSHLLTVRKVGYRLERSVPSDGDG